MITWIYDSQKTMHHMEDGLSGEDITGFCLGADVAVLPADKPNATKIYVMDWFELDSATQAEIGNQILLFDGEGKRWLPQGRA